MDTRNINQLGTKMLIKILDNTGAWRWISDVQENVKVGKSAPNKINAQDYGCQTLEIIGEEQEGETPTILLLKTLTGLRLIAVYGTKGYICAPDTGATIDTIIP